MNNSLIYPDAPRCPVPEGGIVIPEWLDRAWSKEWNSAVLPMVAASDGGWTDLKVPRSIMRQPEAPK